MKLTKHSPVDKGWAWMILLATVINVVLNALIYTTGIFNVVFLERFNESRALTAWCGALHSGLSNLFGVVASLVTEYCGPRKTIGFGALCIFVGFVATYFAKTFTHVFITYGIVIGFGFAFTIVPGYIILGYYFDKYRNITYGVANASIGVGNAALAPLLQFLLDEYGMNGTMLITAAISSHMFIVAALCRTFHPDKQHIATLKAEPVDEVKSEDARASTSKSMNDINSVDVTNRLMSKTVHLQATGSSLLYVTPASSCQSIPSLHVKETHPEKVEIQESTPSSTPRYTKLLSYPFFAWCGNLMLIVAGTSCVYLHFPVYAIAMGTSPDKAALLVMTLGLGNMAVRLTLGFVTNNSKRRTFFAYVGSGLFASVVLFSGPYISRSYAGQIIFALLFSASGNGYSGLMGPLAINLFGLEIFHISFGIGMTLCGVGFIVGPPMAGAVYDYTDSYFYTFMMAGCCYLVAELLMLPLLCFRKLKQQIY